MNFILIDFYFYIKNFYTRKSDNLFKFLILIYLRFLIFFFNERKSILDLIK